MRRRKKRNPGGLTVVLVGAAAFGAAALAFLLTEKKAKASGGVLTATTGTKFAATPAFTGGMLPEAFAQLRAGDCLAAVQGQAGFFAPGDIAGGEIVAMQITGASGGSSVTAISIDPRAPGFGPVSVTSFQTAGAGDC